MALMASGIVILVFSLFLGLQYQSVKQTLLEEKEQTSLQAARALAQQLSHWLNGKITLIDTVAQNISTHYGDQAIADAFNLPVLKKEFLVITGGLERDGKKISNEKAWSPDDWDARTRPWYAYAQRHHRAVLTEPYTDAQTGELLISVVSGIQDKGKFMGAFGGDLSLSSVSEALNTLNFNQTGYAYLLNANGKIISHPDKRFNNQTVSQLYQLRPALTPELQESEIQGTQVLTRFVPVSDVYGSDWLIGVVMDKSEVMASANAFGVRVLISLILATSICSAALYFALSKLMLPMQEIRSSLQEINRGEGDLTKRLQVNAKDEFGQVATDFNSFIRFLQSLICHVKDISNQVKGHTEKTTASVSQASQGLSKQQFELDQLASAMNEMSATAQDVASSAQQAADSANQADKATDEGVDAVVKTSDSIAALNSEMQDLVSTVGELSGYSDNIASILTVITEIADQTNLLALNAAIEAARAGESGRGFAVVAEEVRALASRTQQSAEEIRHMIEQLLMGVKTAQEVIQSSQSKSQDTQDAAQQANQVLQIIRMSIADINQMSAQIATSALQQSTTLEEINRNTVNIRDIGQVIADDMRSQEQSSEQMLTLSAMQDTELNKFRV